VNIISDVGLGPVPQLTTRFELGAEASPDQLVNSIAHAINVVRFQVGLSRAGTFVTELENEVARRVRSNLDPAPPPQWLVQHASSFGLDQPSIVEFLYAQAARWGNEQLTRIRADLAAEVFLNEDAVAEGRLASLAANSRDWRVSHIEYHNPLEIVVISSLGALGAAKWIFWLVGKVQDTLLKSLELKNARIDLGRVEAEAVAAAWGAEQARLETIKSGWEIEKTRLETVKLASEGDKIQSETEAFRAQTRRVEKVEAERARLAAKVDRIEADAAKQAITSAIQSSDTKDDADRRRNAVLLRRMTSDESASAPQVYQQVVQATIDVAFRATIPVNLPATIEQADSLADLPQINEADLTAPDS
jgi:hypothetical protein